ncbi:hypothetical protein J6590_033687 [Homalodisca vitripennis]|nr:hypothetical protein J6590_033687 [Homalodisca vitripennis]
MKRTRKRSSGESIGAGGLSSVEHINWAKLGRIGGGRRTVAAPTVRSFGAAVGADIHSQDLLSAPNKVSYSGNP